MLMISLKAWADYNIRSSAPQKSPDANKLVGSCKSRRGRAKARLGLALLRSGGQHFGLQFFFQGRTPGSFQLDHIEFNHFLAIAANPESV